MTEYEAVPIAEPRCPSCGADPRWPDEGGMLPEVKLGVWGCAKCRAKHWQMRWLPDGGYGCVQEGPD